MSDAYVVMIDIKDGVYDAIHAFTTREAAQEYVAWQEARGGDHCYVCELPLEAEWVPPVDLTAAEDFWRGA